MASPRVEFRTARLVVVATAVLALAVLVVGTFLLVDDFQTRRDQRELAEATSVEPLRELLAGLDADLAGALGAIEDAGVALAAEVGASGEQGDVALAAAVSNSCLLYTSPSPRD